MFVKICGITRESDAEAAVERGASAIGFVFWPNSPRRIDPKRAREIGSRLPASVQRVGVFVNQPAEDIEAIADMAQLSVVQLHGDESPAFGASLRRPVIKAMSVNGGRVDASGWPDETIILMDAHDPVRRGGTGKGADWTEAARLARQRRVLLAGGLTPETVADAVARVRPYGIDVSSGVETSPGVKDPAKLNALFLALEKR